MKKRTQGRETANTASQHKLSGLNRIRSRPEMPNGMTVVEYRQRPGRSFNGKPPARIGNNTWLKIQPRGSNTSGALSGLRASSYPNPVLAPPSSISWSARPWPNPPMAGPLKQGQVLTAPSYTTQVGAET